MKVHCQLPNTNNEIDLEVDQNNTTLKDLKEMIYDKTGTPVCHQTIELENKKLPCRFDEKKLNKLHISESSNIRMIYAIDAGCGCGCDLCGCGGGCRCSIM